MKARRGRDEGVHDRDVRVLEPRRRDRLALEALEALGVGREVGSDELERDPAPAEVEVLGLVDLAHAALADQALSS